MLSIIYFEDIFVEFLVTIFYKFSAYIERPERFSFVGPQKKESQTWHGLRLFF